MCQSQFGPTHTINSRIATDLLTGEIAANAMRWLIIRRRDQQRCHRCADELETGAMYMSEVGLPSSERDRFSDHKSGTGRL